MTKTNRLKSLLLTLILLTSSITLLTTPASAQPPTENPQTNLDELFTLLESSHQEALQLLNQTGDNETHPEAYEKLQLGDEKAAQAYNLNATGQYEEAYEKGLDALELYGEAILLALESLPEPEDEPPVNVSSSNQSSPMVVLDSTEVEASLERAWSRFEEVNSTYHDQGNSTEAESYIDEAYVLLQSADELFALGDYEGAEEAVSGAMEALDSATGCMMEKAREEKGDRALKFLDVRRNSFQGLEAYLSEQQSGSVLAGAVVEVFQGANNANQYIRTLIANGDIDEALARLDEIREGMYESLDEAGLSKDELKELRAMERVMSKAEWLSLKDSGVELKGHGKPVEGEGGPGKSGKPEKPGKPEKSSNGKAKGKNKNTETEPTED
jgi:hypothetical protein